MINFFVRSTSVAGICMELGTPGMHGSIGYIFRLARNFNGNLEIIKREGVLVFSCVPPVLRTHTIRIIRFHHESNNSVIHRAISRIY
jgi:hypothetical protein